MPDPISCKQAEMPSRHGAADHNIETELLAIENERLRAEVRTLRSALKAAGRVIGSYRPTQRCAAAALIFNGVVCTCEARSAHPSAPTRRASSGPGLAQRTGSRRVMPRRFLPENWTALSLTPASAGPILYAH